MKQRFILYRRSNGTFYSEDTVTRRQESLRTKNEDEARTLLNAKNEAVRQPTLNVQIAQVYLQHGNPEVATRAWQTVMEQIIATKQGNTRERWDYAIQDEAFDFTRNRKLVETSAEHFLDVLKRGSVSTNVYLRRLHKLCDRNELATVAGASEKAVALDPAQGETCHYVRGASKNHRS
jgi:hypothetical protein